MRIVHARETISRADITKHTHLAQQSVHRLVEGLIEKELFSPTEPVIRGRGKPSPQITINPERYVALGVGLSTSNIDLSGVDLNGHLIFSDVIDVDPGDCQAVASAVGEAAEQKFLEPPLKDRQAIGIGVSVQGYRKGNPNRYGTPDPITSWTNQPIDTLFADATGLPAFTENNANCCAIAEYYCGGGTDLDCFAYLSFNMGLGGGLLYMGQPFFGGHGNAGELTRTYVEGDRKHRPALGELLERLRDNGIKVDTVHDLASRFDADWPGVAEWVEEVTPALNILIRALTSIADPCAIFFGGEAPTALRKMLIEAGRVPDEDGPPSPRLALSAIEGDASSIGAAILPLQRMIY